MSAFALASIIGVPIGLVLAAHFSWRSPFPLGAAFQKGVTIRMGQCNVLNYIDDLMRMIEEGKIDPSFVITHKVALDEAPKMYDTFKKKEDGCIKVVMKPNG